MKKGGGRRERVRDRRAGPENGLFFPIKPNNMLWRMKGGKILGDKPDVSPLLGQAESAWKTGAAYEFRYRV